MHDTVQQPITALHVIKNVKKRKEDLASGFAELASSDTISVPLAQQSVGRRRKDENNVRKNFFAHRVVRYLNFLPADVVDFSSLCHFRQTISLLAHNSSQILQVKTSANSKAYKARVKALTVASEKYSGTSYIQDTN